MNTPKELSELRAVHEDLERHIQAHVERVVGRALLKVGIAGTVSSIIAIGTAVWTVKDTLDRVNHLIEGNQVELTDLRNRVKRADEAYTMALEAKHQGDVTAGTLNGHLRPDVVVKQRY